MVTQTLSTIPQIVDIEHYGGDTLSVLIRVPAAVVAGRDWDAQVRRTRDAEDVDAIFDVIPGNNEDETFLRIPGEVVAGLVKEWSTPVRVNGKQVLRYVGVWDVQVSVGGADPITTFAQGSLIIDPDVTRRPQ